MNKIIIIILTWEFKGHWATPLTSHKPGGNGKHWVTTSYQVRLQLPIKRYKKSLPITNIGLRLQGSKQFWKMHCITKRQTTSTLVDRMFLISSDTTNTWLLRLAHRLFFNVCRSNYFICYDAFDLTELLEIFEEELLYFLSPRAADTLELEPCSSELLFPALLSSSSRDLPPDALRTIRRSSFNTSFERLPRKFSPLLQQ